MWRFFITALIITLSFSCWQPTNLQDRAHLSLLGADSAWADSTLQHLTLNQKIGQLLVLRSDLQQSEQKDSLIKWALYEQLGGVLLENLPVDTFMHYVTASQQMTRLPLLNGTTERVALHNQFSDAINFPNLATIGLASDSLQQIITEKYQEQCEALHINFAYAPTIPLNNNYKPTAFSMQASTRQRYNQKWLESTHKNKILSFGTGYNYYEKRDSSLLTPLDLQEWEQLSRKGLNAVVVTKDFYKNDTLLSEPPNFLPKYLEQKLQFNGLVVSELNSQNSLAQMTHAGTDLYIIRDSIDVAFRYLKDMIKTGLLSEATLDNKVRKVLLAKNLVAKDHHFLPDTPPLRAQQSILPKAQFASFKKEKITIPVKSQHPITAYFQDADWEPIVYQLYEEALILANNPNNVLPFREIQNRDFRIYQYGGELTTFQKYFAKYADADTYSLKSYSECNEIPVLDTKGLIEKTIILTINQENIDTFLCNDWLKSVNQLSEKTDIVVINMGDPSVLAHFAPTVNSIQIMERHNITEALAAQLIFGGVSAMGKLPINIAPHLPYDRRLMTPIIRLKYTIPAETGIAPERLVGINAIAQTAINNKAFPGCQVLIAKDGKVIYNENFGYHTYEKKRPVRSQDLYDLASVTKVASTTLATMKLYEQEQIKPTDRLSQHLTLRSRSTIRNINLRNLLIHQSGLRPNLPIVKYLLDRDSLNAACNRYFCTEETSPFSIKIADNFYFNQQSTDTIWTNVQKLRLSRRRYRYSDVNFYLLQKVIETKSHLGLDQYVGANFYHPLNMRRTRYNPLEAFYSSEITPTSLDSKWRKQFVHGYVHDETAALQGGIGGNAGLFSTAEDMAILSQMLLNGGQYGGRRYLKPATIEYFTTAKHGNHRGLGFDKPKSGRKNRAYAESASSKTYGHTGFSGTCIWVDPQYNLVYVFLSNRIHPHVNNKLLYEDKVRSRIHQVVYDAMGTFDGELPKLVAEKKL